MKFVPIVAIFFELCVISTAYADPNLIFSGARKEGLDAIDNKGDFWGTDEDNGRYSGQLVKYSIVGGNVLPTPYSSSFTGDLMPKGGIHDPNSEADIQQVWPLPDGSVLFTTATSPNRYNYLYKLKPSTNSVGNNAPNYDNKQAVMNMGERGNGPQADIRALHHRSLLVATINQAVVLFYGEYNVSDKAWVALWKSSNMGDTWSKVIEWNTVGHQTRHIHGVVQNPYNGWIYILFGDDDPESAIVAWDGLSTPPPDNTPFDQINNYSGWKAIAGSQALRSGDLVFTPPPNGKCVWIPDVDTVNPGESLYAQRANYDLTGLEATSAIPYTNGNPAILGYRDANSGNIYWSSFKIAGADKNFTIWSSNNSGLTWSLASKVSTNSDWTTVPHNFYVAPWGQLILTGRDVRFLADGLHLGGSALLQVGVQPINTAPVAQNDVGATTQGRAVTINLLANDTDAEANISPASVTIGTQPINGQVVVNVDGTAIYTPTPGFTGTNTFTYTVKDTLGLISNPATITVSVTSLVAVNDSYVATANSSRSQAFSITAAQGVGANDLPSGVKGLTYTVVSGIKKIGSSAIGNVALSLNNANGAFNYLLIAPTNALTSTQRKAAKRGTYQFSYAMTVNGVTTAPATVTITVK
ncbi:MAG: Ig-like domain-containing protein [Methylococcaceae bacterium]|nr:Ig-like domain-containing protein [Methylococcaceae bacterium]